MPLTNSWPNRRKPADGWFLRYLQSLPTSSPKNPMIRWWYGRIWSNILSRNRHLMSSNLQNQLAQLNDRARGPSSMESAKRWAVRATIAQLGKRVEDDVQCMATMILLPKLYRGRGGQSGRSYGNGRDGGSSGRKCFHCGGVGHMVKYCPSPSDKHTRPNSAANFAFLASVILCESPRSEHITIDAGTTSHMTNKKDWVTNCKALNSPEVVVLGDGQKCLRTESERLQWLYR